MEMDDARNGGHHYSTSNLSMPSFNLSFPMGSFGAMGLSLWQHFSSSFNEDSENNKIGSNVKLEYQGSVYELVPTYAIRLPFFRSLSLGASAHVVMGNTSRNLTLGGDASEIEKSDAWATGKYLVSDYVDGTWEIKDHPAYYTGALQYRGKLASYFLSFTTGYTLQNTLDYNFRFSEIDTLSSTRSTREIDVPAMLATGINYRLAKRHNVMMDLTWRVWDKDIENIAGGWNMPEVTETQTDFMVSLGYQCDGSPLFYESYWNRINYRAGAWYRNWYIKDAEKLAVYDTINNPSLIYSKWAYNNEYSDAFHDLKERCVRAITEVILPNISQTKRVNIFVSHDMFIGPLTVYCTNKKINRLRYWETDMWVYFVSGIAIVIKPNGERRYIPIDGIEYDT